MTVKRIVFLQKLMSFVGLEKRLHLAWISSAEAQRFARVVTEFTEKVRDMGPSPIKELKSPNTSPRFPKGEKDPPSREREVSDRLGKGFPHDGIFEAKVIHHGS